MDEAIRPLIIGRAASSTIAQKAMARGMRTLRNDGWKKVKAGQTTIDEVLRVTQTEEHLMALVRRRENQSPQERFLMARWYSANVLQSMPGGRRLWQLLRQGRATLSSIRKRP